MRYAELIMGPMMLASVIIGVNTQIFGITIPADYRNIAWF